MFMDIATLNPYPINLPSLVPYSHDIRLIDTEIGKLFQMLVVNSNLYKNNYKRYILQV